MYPATHPLPVFLTIISTTLFINGAALQPQHPHVGAGTCIATERAALLSFKKGITNDTAGLLSSWRGHDCCRWRGVTCNNLTGNIIKLHLRNPHPDDANGCMADHPLVGEISPSLLSLDHLEYLDLSMNCFKGGWIKQSLLEGIIGTNPSGPFPIPSFLGSIRSLKHLDLSGIPFDGEVSRQLGNLSKLQYLNLGIEFTPFSFIPFFQPPSFYSSDVSWLTNLRLLSLTMSHVNLSRIVDWPRKLNMIPSLRSISLTACSLDSAKQQIPFLNLTKLEKLDLSYNFFNHTYASSWFWIATSLRYLILHDTRLFGQLPKTVGNLTSLQVFDLSYNENNDLMLSTNLRNLCSLEILDLTYSSINKDIANLMGRLPLCTEQNLQELHFSQNRITGTLPSSIGKYSGLITLVLKYNNLVGSLPTEIGTLTNLTTLDLSNNNLSGSVPTQIGFLTNLSSLDLSSNNFIGVITEEHLSHLIHLKILALSPNNIKVQVDEDWFPPFKLKYALLASCHVGPHFPSWLQKQLEIIYLDISRNAIVSNIPDWFWPTLSSAVFLDISDNQISGSLPDNLHTMAFQALNLSSNQLTGSLPHFPENIYMIDISNNSFSGTLPSDFDAQYIETLIMFSNEIGGRIPESICKSISLTDIDLSNNRLVGEIPQCPYWYDIRFFLVSNNNLSGNFPVFLRNSISLWFLDLSRNKFTGRLPSWIGETDLMILQLSHNSFSGDIPLDIANMKYLQYLDLSCNKFSGAIPSNLSNLHGMTLNATRVLRGNDADVGDGNETVGEFTINDQYGEIMSVVTKGQQLRYGGTFVYFVSIDLSSNFLTGEIPPDITSFDALINLNLSSNQLSGKIPHKIGLMQSLESLDLSNNKLSSEIPSSLANLTSLVCLNLSYNNLSGRIPTSRQLDTLNVDKPSLMYIGNSGLCGPPLERSCSGNDSFIHGSNNSNRKEIDLLSFYYGLVLGLVVGLWIVFCAMLFKKTWRIRYFQLFDTLYDRIYVFVVVKWASFVTSESAQ